MSVDFTTSSNMSSDAVEPVKSRAELHADRNEEPREPAEVKRGENGARHSNDRIFGLSLRRRRSAAKSGTNTTMNASVDAAMGRKRSNCVMNA